jgi:hypothetical protein
MIHALSHHLLPALASALLSGRDFLAATGLAWGALYLIDWRFPR